MNSKRAITECLENALDGQPNLDCDLIIIYSAMGHNFKELLSEIRKISPGARIAGCTCGGVIGKSGVDESMKALAIMAIKGPKEEFALVCRKESAKDNPFSAISQMATDLKTMNPGITMVQFLAPTAGNAILPIEKALEGIKSVFGKNIPVFGGFAMTSLANLKISDLEMVPFLFFDDEIIENGAVMVGYADQTLKFINHANHGFDILEGMPLEVTKSQSNIIYELNGEPAWRKVTRTLGVPESYGALQILVLSGFAREIPENLWEDNGSKFIISVAMGKNEDGSFMFPVECPVGTKLYLTKRDERVMFDGVDLMVRKINDELQGKKPVAVFQTDCILRGKFSIDRILKDEITYHMQGPICKGEDIPWLGFYAGGEFFMLGREVNFQQISSSLFVIYRD
ncbi:MAG: FIST C-terminal domain-containing protein [Bacteroidia bacterium]|nr:FIST C-terminal domain-containing protein [Bacteroidia bacterium]